MKSVNEQTAVADGIPDPTENVQDQKAQVYTVRRGEEEISLTVDALLTLAEKGLDYDRVNGELERLSADAEKKRIEEYELEHLFPGTDPDAVRSDAVAAAHIRNGLPLAAAYALSYAESRLKERIDAENASRSTGSAGTRDARGEFISDAQLESMSVNEIKRVFPQIMRRFRKG